MRRRFYLENETGSRVGLMGRSGIWFHNIEGLGFEEGDDFADLENGFFLKTNKKKKPMLPVTGDLTFMGTRPYEDYHDFVKWIAKAKELYLIYAPGVTEFRRSVSMQQLSKSELKAGWLTVPVTFSPLTPWYRPASTDLEIDSVEDDAIYFDSEESVIDEAILTENIYCGSLTYIAPEGHLPSAWRLEYIGAVTNPIVTLTGITTGTEYGRCALDISLDEGDALILDTRIQGGGVWLQRAGSMVDLIDKVDLSYEPFPQAAITETSLLRISGDGDVTGRAAVKVFRYYYTV